MLESDVKHGHLYGLLSLSLSLSLSFYIRAEYNKQTVVLDNVDRWESITIGVLVICFTFHM